MEPRHTSTRKSGCEPHMTGSHVDFDTRTQYKQCRKPTDYKPNCVQLVVGYVHSGQRPMVGSESRWRTQSGEL